MDDRRAATALVLALTGALALVAALVATGSAPLVEVPGTGPDAEDGPRVIDGRGTPPPGYERATVTVYDGNGTALGTVRVLVADTPGERYTGLSDTERLADGWGLLFVFDAEAERAFVMRDMDFPLDIVFVGADGHVTAIHHAAVPPPGTDDGDLTRYRGRAKWVLEAPRGWTAAHGVSVGDRVEIESAS